MSVFSELKRRNVFKVALAYLVASWLVLQITDVLMGVLSLPETAGKFVFMLLVIGFIPAMVFAWAYEVTPEGIKRESEVDRSESMTQETAAQLNRTTIVLLVAVAVMVVVDRFVPEALKGSDPISQSADSTTVTPKEEELDPTPVSGALTPQDATPSVAVLPFVNMSSDAENEYFSDGITEELLNLLVRVDGLRVPSRTSSFAFKGQNTDIRDIARQLEVNHILEGSVRKAGNQVRITAQLIDVGSDTHLWSDTYDRELEDIFAIQDEIASKIVQELELTLTGSRNEDRPTDSIEAYNLYLQGLYQFRQRGDFVRDAEVSLRGAVELDPEFAEAWGLLGLNYMVQPNYVHRPLEEIAPLALEAAARTEALDSTLVEPLLIRANLAGKQSRFLDSIRAYESAVELNPKDALARLWLGIDLLMMGYLEEALRQLEIARKLDPAAGIIVDWQARTLYMTGEPDRSEEYAKRGIALDRPASAVALLHLYLYEQRYDELHALVNELGTHEYWTAWARLAEAKQFPKRTGETLDWANRFKDSGEIPERNAYAHIQLFLGDVATGLQEVKERIPYDATWYSVFWWPTSAHVRRHPSFNEFARDMGLVEFWQTRGWPDLCRPLGEDDFECDS